MHIDKCRKEYKIWITKQNNREHKVKKDANKNYENSNVNIKQRKMWTRPA